jgi:hypothetical protein
MTLLLGRSTLPSFLISSPMAHTIAVATKRKKRLLTDFRLTWVSPSQAGKIRAAEAAHQSFNVCRL